MLSFIKAPCGRLLGETSAIDRVSVQAMHEDDMMNGLAQRHGHMLLDLLGVDIRPAIAGEHPALGWRRAGLMRTTGLPHGPALSAPVALTAAADGALAALRAIAPHAALPASGGALLGERSRLLMLSRQGAISPNGSCRLLMAGGGSFALNLPRTDDWAYVPALLGEPADNWNDITRLSAGHPRGALLAQGRLLGLAIAADDAVPPPSSPFQISRPGMSMTNRSRRAFPLVVDLSSLWAGPLAGALLLAAGACVVKVESLARPDAARHGDCGFYDLLNAGKASVALDFTRSVDVSHLRQLIDRADIIIEASRPRALAALGIDCDAVVARGATWLSITAHGRSGDAAHWIGFGDDAAVAGGLSAAMARVWDELLIAGDAIADPLTGITAALAGWASWVDGGGRLVSLAMADVVAHAIALYEASRSEVRHWQTIAEADNAPLYPARQRRGAARLLGADTTAVLADLA